MKVILLEDIPNFGKKYEVKDVKDGYARNFLIPKKLVKPASKENIAWVVDQKKIMETAIEEGLKKAQETASKLDGSEVEIAVKIGEDGQIFESVNAQKVAEKLKSLGFDIKKSQVGLKKPIKEAGEFPVKISLDHNLECGINLIVTAAS